MDGSVSSSGEEDLHTALQHVTTATAAATQPQLVTTAARSAALPAVNV